MLAAASAQAKSADTDRAVTDISRYCQACWRNARLPADHWPDATQQVFVRLLERVDPTRWEAALKDDGEERKEFLRRNLKVQNLPEASELVGKMNCPAWAAQD